MERSAQSILTTHTGSLPRPAALRAALRDQPANTVISLVREAVIDAVGDQDDAGIDVINDGEMGKLSYATYVTDRLGGFTVDERLPMAPEIPRLPEHPARTLVDFRARSLACEGPIHSVDTTAIERDVTNLAIALEGVPVTEAFMTAASPGVIAFVYENRHYATHEDYVAALADAMKPEYDAIHAAGFLLQLDCPDLAQVSDPRIFAMHLEALDHATRDIPPERLRMHLGWGNCEGSQHVDVSLRDIIEPVLRARPAGIGFGSANPRHEHEWQVFEEVRVPDDKVLIPGMIDSATNYIEHPELVAQRIERYVRLVGPEKVIAGSDCGFGWFAQSPYNIDPAIAWAKLSALVDGAALATRALWRVRA